MFDIPNYGLVVRVDWHREQTYRTTEKMKTFPSLFSRFFSKMEQKTSSSLRRTHPHSLSIPHTLCTPKFRHLNSAHPVYFTQKTLTRSKICANKFPIIQFTRSDSNYWMRLCTVCLSLIFTLNHGRVVYKLFLGLTFRKSSNVKRNRSRLLSFPEKTHRSEHCFE